MLVMATLVIRDLFKGATAFGKWKFARADNANKYWGVLVFYTVAIITMFLMAVKLAGETIGCDAFAGRPCIVTVRIPQ